MALWSNDFICNLLYEFIKACRSGCNPSLRRGYCTHKRNIYWKMTHICEKNGLCYATAKILQCGKKNKRTVKCAVGKDSRKKKNANRRCSKNAQRRKITLKQLAQPRNNDEYLRIRQLLLYDDHNNRAVIGKVKMQHEKQTEMRLAKRFIQRLRFSNPGFNYRATSTARDRLQLNTFR